MAFGFETKQPDWTVQQQLWVLSCVTDGHTHQEIYDALISETSDMRPAEVACWKGTFRAFRARLQRLTKNGIDPTVDSNTGERFNFDLGTARGRWDYWQFLAKTTNSLTTRIQALQMIEKLAPQFENKDEEEDDGMTPAERRVRGQHILLNWDTFAEVIAMELREKVQGGHTPQVVAFLSDLLNLLSTQDRIEAIKHATDATLIPSLLAEESRNDKLLRLRVEISALSEDELQALENKSDLNDDSDEENTI